MEPPIKEGWILEKTGAPIRIYEGYSLIRKENGILKQVCSTRIGPNRVRWFWIGVFNVKCFFYKLSHILNKKHD